MKILTPGKMQHHATRRSLSGAALIVAAMSWAKPASPQVWSQLSPLGTLPSARADATAIYNPATNSMVMFAGLTGSCSTPGEVTLNDTWLLSSANGFGTPTWTNLIPNGDSGAPPARRGHTAVYDAANDRMTIFGGDALGCSSKFNDVWVLANATGHTGTPSWIQLSPTGGPPTARSDTTAVYDRRNNIMIVSGGTGDFGSPIHDTWVLTNANGLNGTPKWMQLAPTGGPPTATWARATVYDPASNRMTVFGGGNCCGGTLYNEVWVLTGANGLEAGSQWIQLSPTGTAPKPRLGPTAVYDQPSNRMVVFGGDLSTQNPPTAQSNSVWVLTHANGLNGTPAWLNMTTSGTPPSPRGGDIMEPTMVYDQRTDHFLIFGGASGNTVLNDSWVLQTQSLAASPFSLSFPGQTVGTPSASMTITLINTGSTAVTNLSVGLVGTSSGDFAQINDCGTGLNASASCTITVTFTPSATGARSASVQVSDKASINQRFLPLKGTGM